MPPEPHVELWLAKAAQDEWVVERLINDPETPDEILGFHAQQAAEKLLKAALSARRIAFPRTHQLDELLDLAREQGLAVPEELEDLRYLSPFAVELRYDILPSEPDEALDRPALRTVLAHLRVWTSQIIQQQ
jgi:HEPN domain-containing protein